MYESTVSSDGSATIPAEVRKLFGVGSGDTICWYQQWSQLRRLLVFRAVPNPSGKKLTESIAILAGCHEEGSSTAFLTPDVFPKFREKTGKRR